MQIIQTIHMYIDKLHGNPVSSKQYWIFHYVDYDGCNRNADQEDGKDNEDFKFGGRSLIFVMSNLLSL